MRMWRLGFAAAEQNATASGCHCHLSSLDPPVMQEASNSTIENLRDRLRVRAEGILSESAPGAAASVQMPAFFKKPPEMEKKNSLPKASSNLAKWLKDKIARSRRFPNNLLLRFSHHRSLYEQLQRFSEETSSAGTQLNAGYASLLSGCKGLARHVDEKLAALDARLGRSESDDPAMIASLSREVAELRRQVAELKAR